MNKGNILLTMAEVPEKTTKNHFAVKYSVDEEDCFDFSNGLQELDYSVYFVNWNDLDFKKGTFNRMFNDNKKSFVNPLSLDEIDLIFIYKQEGFLFNVPEFYEMLDIFDSTNALKINDIKTIKKNISKEYLIDLAREGLAVAPTYTIDDSVLKRINKNEPFIIKPKIGERGNLQKKVTCLDDLTDFKDFDDYVAQEFCPDIRNGERSLVFLGHEYSHAVLKKPNPKNPDEYRCNESLGGTVEVYQPTKKELDFSKKVLQKWEDWGYPVHFSRIDLIVDAKGEPKVLEAELLNPSIYANYSGIGSEFGRKIANYFDNKLQNLR